MENLLIKQSMLVQNVFLIAFIFTFELTLLKKQYPLIKGTPVEERVKAYLMQDFLLTLFVIFHSIAQSVLLFLHHR